MRSRPSIFGLSNYVCGPKEFMSVSSAVGP